MSATRERLHEMLDLILEDRLIEAEASLTRLLDPVGLAFLNAPEDDEETTEDDIRALEEARADYERGETMSLDDVMRELDRAPRAGAGAVDRP